MTMYRKFGLIVLTICATANVGYWCYQNLQAVESLPTSSSFQPRVLDEREATQRANKVAAIVGNDAFKISPEAMQSAFHYAALELAERSDLKRRRPTGLEGIDSPEELCRCINAAIHNWEDRWLALDQLEYLGDLAFDDLIKNTKPAFISDSHRCELLILRGKNGIASLTDMVKNAGDPDAQRAAAGILGHARGNAAAVPTLIEIIKSVGDDDIQISSFVEALAQTGDRRAIKPLQRLAARLPNMPHSGWMAWYVTEAIKRIEASPECLAWPEELHDLQELCVNARTIKGESYGPTEISQLLSHIDSSSSLVSEACLDALGSLNVASAVPEIIGRVPQPRSFSVLAKLGTPEAVELLLLALHSPDRDLREAAIRALGQSRRRWPAAVLVELLSDESLYESRPCHLHNPKTDTCPDQHVAHLMMWAAIQPQKWSSIPCHCECWDWIPDARKEVPLVHAWWQEHRHEFLSGRLDKKVRPQRVIVLVGGADE